MPPDVIEQFGLTPDVDRTIVLAHEQSVILRTFRAVVSWHERQSNVFVIEADGQPLLGMSMLWGSKLTLEAWDGGEVTIEEMRLTTE